MTASFGENRALSRRPVVLPLLAAAGFSLACCNSQPPPETPAQPPPPERPPTPKSITRANPGGDADDPIKAALNRLLNEPILVRRRDRWRTLRVPLPDWKNWRRIKITGHPTRANFQYGDEHIGLVTIRYSEITGPNDPEHCLADFVKEASPIAEGYGIRLGQSSLLHLTQTVKNEQRPILIRIQEGGIDSVLANDDYVGMIAAYSSWPGTCLVMGAAILSTEHPELAIKVRDRWVNEGLAKLTWAPKLKEAPDPTQTR